jgi:hypothetical protein
MNPASLRVEWRKNRIGRTFAVTAPMARWISVIAVLTATFGCASAPTAPDTAEVCGGFGDWQSSPYVLPFQVGASFFVDQGNCSPPGNGHRGAAKYGHDFMMPIGTPLHAARGGVVVQVEESHFDGQIAATGFDNVIVIAHDDGSTALYGHLTHDGSVVAVGDRVAQGALIGYSGNTGNTDNKPLHLSAASCDPVARGTSQCPTLPVNFRNTEPNPQGLVRGRTYGALSY